jgi:hypothetical protein
MAQVRHGIRTERLAEEALEALGQTSIVEELKRICIMCQRQLCGNMALLLDHFKRVQQIPSITPDQRGWRTTSHARSVQRDLANRRRTMDSGSITMKGDR